MDSGADKGIDKVGHGTDKGTDEDREGRWLTYGELAALRRIDRHSAVKLVTRHRWRRQKDNRGVLRVLVPTEWTMSKDKGPDIGSDAAMDRGTDGGTDKGTDTDAFETALAAIEAAHASEVAGLRGQVDAAAAALAGERMRADTADADRRAAEARADRALARADQERLAADRFRGEAEAVRGELAQAVERRTAAEVEARVLREAENARQQLGRWRRAWRGWRGR
jgi:hypothetical protein